jgi:pectin methylesterase-like acyl-CoA thioesterase/lysophospholipase L1-like esterase
LAAATLPVAPPALAASTVPLRVILVGDSTIATRTGYGDAFCGLFRWQVECVNAARGGRSTKSYRADGSWESVLTLLRDRSTAGATYVLVQFGHNDQPGKAERSTDLATEYPANLRRYVQDIRREQAWPVLVTPLTRRIFREDGSLSDDLEPWTQAMRTVAAEEGVPLLDLHADSATAVARMGAAEAEKLALATTPGAPPDRTHVGPRGAALFARLLARRVVGDLYPLADQFAPGAIEPPGRVARPQLLPERLDDYSYRAVLRDWDPLGESGPPAAAFTPDYIVDASQARAEPPIFPKIQDAVAATLARANAGERRRFTLLVRRGTYEELVYLPASAPPITLVGESTDPGAVRIRVALDARTTGERYAQRFGAEFEGTQADIAAMFDSVRRRPAVGTPGSAVVWVKSHGFRARNLTIENAWNKDRGDAKQQSQAVALLLDDADRAHLDNVRLLGFQDTFFAASSAPERPAAAFVHRSRIEGDMDFVFGEGTVYFLDSEIRSLGDRAISYTLAPATHYRSPHGFVFERCRFTHDGSANARAGVFKLARQWYRSREAVGKVAILHSAIGEHIDPVRPWADWSIGTPRHRAVDYDAREYWDRLIASGIDPERDLGYPPLSEPPEAFLVEYGNRAETVGNK